MVQRFSIWYHRGMNHKSRLAAAVENFRSKLTEVRTDRPSAALFANVQVDLQPGAQVPLRRMASISVQDSRTVLIEAYEASTVRVIEKGLHRASMNPTVTGTSLFVHMPPMSEERRDELCKQVRTLMEEFKVSIRAIRREWLDADGSTKIVEVEVKSSIEKIESLAKDKQTAIRS